LLKNDLRSLSLASTTSLLCYNIGMSARAIHCRTFLILLIIVSVLIADKSSFAANATFNRTLRVGMSGEDVRQLQKILNSDLRTRINSSGAGSAGLETTYFGSLTKDAVIRFQNLHPEEILKPNGLSVGTGIVGPFTIAVISTLATKSVAVISASPVASSSLSQSAASQTNPNLKNLDKFLATIERVSAKQGVSAAQIAAIKNKIMKDVATTTNLEEKFINLVKSQSSLSYQSLQSDSLFGSTLAHIEKIIKGSFFPKKAHAQSAESPFGGELYYSYECDCSDTWLLDIQPLPPDYATLLTYMPGSQAYLSYNIPGATWLLGDYSNSGVCEIYVGEGCASVSNEGMITPTVGSSP